jgi:inner membrane transporter RhtA
MNPDRDAAFPRRRRPEFPPVSLTAVCARRNSTATESPDIAKPARSAAWPILLLIAAITCFQVGTSLAKQLFPAVGATGTTALRIATSALMLLAAWRPWRMRFTRAQARTILIYGLALGCMNLSFYNAIHYIPLGIAVALEFTGPLAVAVAGSRRPIDFIWIALAVLGLLAILPIGLHGGRLPPAGIALALCAGVCWALYIVYGRRAGAAHGGQTTALGMLVAAMLVVPVGIAKVGPHLFAAHLLPLALAVGLVSSALPYSLEMIAMPRVPARTVGVLMSLDPALAAVAGLVLLHEHLSLLQWGAVACIIVASAGSAATRDAQALPD